MKPPNGWLFCCPQKKALVFANGNTDNRFHQNTAGCEMLEWTIPFLVKAASGATAWKWLKVKGGGNVHAVAVEYKAAHPEVVGYDTSQAWERWL